MLRSSARLTHRFRQDKDPADDRIEDGDPPVLKDAEAAHRASYDEAEKAEEEAAKAKVAQEVSWLPTTLC